MVDPCGPNVVDGPFLWLNTRPVILGRAFDHICQPIARAVRKPKRQSVFHRNLGGARGGIDSHHPVHLRKWLWSQKEPEPFIYLMERATGSPRVCFANPCFAAGHWPLRAALENAHAFSQLRTLPGSIPVARHACENGSGTK